MTKQVKLKDAIMMNEAKKLVNRTIQENSKSNIGFVNTLNTVYQHPKYRVYDKNNEFKNYVWKYIENSYLKSTQVH